MTCFSNIFSTNICAICLENTKKNEEIVTMDLCNHQYHKNCAIETLDVKEECPLCRKRITWNVKQLIKHNNLFKKKIDIFNNS